MFMHVCAPQTSKNVRMHRLNIHEDGWGTSPPKGRRPEVAIPQPEPLFLPKKAKKYGKSAPIGSDGGLSAPSPPSSPSHKHGRQTHSTCAAPLECRRWAHCLGADHLHAALRSKRSRAAGHVSAHLSCAFSLPLCPLVSFLYSQRTANAAARSPMVLVRLPECFAAAPSDAWRCATVCAGVLIAVAG